jgi:ketosteroid isomerase-like protein
VRAEHLTAIRELYDAMSRGDLETLRDAEAVHPDFSWTAASDEPDPSERRGVDDSLGRARELLEVFEQVDVAIEEEIDLDEEHAIFVVNLGVRGATSGVTANRMEAHLWTLSDGRLASLQEFPSVGDAREAAG